MDFGAAPPHQPPCPGSIGSKSRTTTAIKNQFNFDISITVKWPTDVHGQDQQNENSSSSGTQCPGDSSMRVQDQMGHIERNCVRAFGNRADFCFLVARRAPAADVLDIRVACCSRASVTAGAIKKDIRDGIVLPAMTQGLDGNAKRAFQKKMQDLRQIFISTRQLVDHQLFDSHQAATLDHGYQVLLSRYPRALVGQRIGTSGSCKRSILSDKTGCKAFEVKITFATSDGSHREAALKHIKKVLTRSAQQCIIVSEACIPLASVVCGCTYATSKTTRILQKQLKRSIFASQTNFSVQSSWVSVDAMVDHTISHAFRETLSGATVLHWR